MYNLKITYNKVIAQTVYKKLTNKVAQKRKIIII